MSLLKLLQETIDQSGPISMAEYMQLCLGHPEYGYYITRDPIGKKGDFTTAPEISQLFGEMLGLWIANQWMEDGKPKPFNLVEFGPGRGTLMADMLRATKHVPEFHQYVSVQMVETSPILKAKQQEALSAYDFISWHESIDTALKPNPTYIVANEFFDALPVRQFCFTDKGWREIKVGLKSKDELQLQQQPCLPPSIPIKAPKSGDVLEISPVSTNIMQALAHHTASYGGSGVIIDYGYTMHAYGDTVQAVKDHEYTSIINNPGECDLTAHVNFAALKESALREKIEFYYLCSQKEFLETIGIEIRANALKESASDSQKRDIDKALERLLGDDQMGRLFQCFTFGNKLGS